MLDTAKLRRLRDEAGLSQAEAAAKVFDGRSRQWWHNIESGLQANVTLETLDQIARALGVKAKDLLK
jgi:transcriptional regulator with XRE-family HTH domain